MQFHANLVGWSFLDTITTMWWWWLVRAIGGVIILVGNLFLLVNIYNTIVVAFFHGGSFSFLQITHRFLIFFLSDLANYKGMNEVFNQYFAENPPARATVRADIVLPTLLVEIDAIAVVG